MSLPRVRLESCVCENGTWLIDEEQARHLVRVRRCYSGSLVEGLLDGQKIELRLECSGDAVRAAEVSRGPERPMASELHLFLALLKNDQFDEALRFAAETGVHTIHLVSCERSVPRFSDAKAAEKMARWRRVLSESTKQAGAAAAPLIMPPVDFSSFDFASLPRERYAALLSPDAVPLNRIPPTDRAVVAIGPEGDWAPHEAAALLGAGFTAVSLGRRILRASTAVAVACGWFINAGEK